MKSNRITRRIPRQPRIVIPEVIVIEPTLPILILSGEPNPALTTQHHPKRQPRHRLLGRRVTVRHRRAQVIVVDVHDLRTRAAAVKRGEPRRVEQHPHAVAKTGHRQRVTAAGGVVVRTQRHPLTLLRDLIHEHRGHTAIVFDAVLGVARPLTVATREVHRHLVGAAVGRGERVARRWRRLDGARHQRQTIGGDLAHRGAAQFDGHAARGEVNLPEVHPLPAIHRLVHAEGGVDAALAHPVGRIRRPHAAGLVARVELVNAGVGNGKRPHQRV